MDMFGIPIFAKQAFVASLLYLAWKEWPQKHGKEDQPASWVLQHDTVDGSEIWLAAHHLGLEKNNL